MKKQIAVKLRFAICVFVIMTIFFTTIINWVSSTQALKDSLTENYLESNEKYAKKLAISTNTLVRLMQENLSTLASIIGHQEINQGELDRWREANNKYFNSLFITNTEGVIQLVSPAVLRDEKTVTEGTKLETEPIKQALNFKKPFISNPYRATTGQLIVLVSYPIFDKNDTFIGLLGGGIHLEESENALYHMMYEHEKVDDSYVFVVDQYGHIIFHPDKNRINDQVSVNPVVKKVLDGKSGSQITVNTKGREFFAAYAYEDSTGWGIVSQTPTSVIKKPLQELLQKMFLRSIPLLFIILIFGWILTSNLAKPLVTLSKFAVNALHQNKVSAPLHGLELNSRIYEIRQLYQHFNSYINLLNIQILQDGLTGLANRRTFDNEIQGLFEQKIPFTVIMLDIDFFKKVNDTYGHLVGDDVLKELAKVISQFTEQGDLCFRYGGEEFGILLIGKNENDAYKIAEKLREEVAAMPTPMGEPITISLGISSFLEDDDYPFDVVKRADSALYESKLNGRNMTTVYKK